MEPRPRQARGQTKSARPSPDDETSEVSLCVIFKRFTRGLVNRPPEGLRLYLPCDSHFPLKVIQNERTMSFRSSQKLRFRI